MTIQRVFLLSLVFSFSLIFLVYFRQAAFRSDFISYYTAASILKDGKGTDLYNIQEQDTYEKRLVNLHGAHLPYRYLPFVAVVFRPFANLSFIQGFVVFTLLNIGILVWYILTAEKVFTRFKHPAFLSAIVLCYIPNLQTILGGQISLIISLLILFIYLSLKNKKNFLTGILTGFMLVKIQYIIIIPFLFFLVKKKRQFLGGLCISLGIILAVSLWVTGFEGLSKYPSFLLATERPEYSTWYWHSFAFYSFIRSLPFFNTLNLPTLLAINMAFYVGFLILFIKKIKNKTLEQSFSLAIIATFLFSVHALRQDLTLLMTPIFIFLNLSTIVKGDQRRTTLIQASVLYLLFFFLALTKSLLGEFNWSALALIWVLWAGFSFNIHLKLKNTTTVAKKDHINRL